MELLADWLIPPIPPTGITVEDVNETHIVFSFNEPYSESPQSADSQSVETATVLLPRQLVESMGSQARCHDGAIVDWIDALLMAFALHRARGRESRTLGERAYGRVQRDHVRGMLARLEPCHTEWRLRALERRYSMILADKHASRGVWANGNKRIRLLALVGQDAESMELRVEQQVAAAIERHIGELTRRLSGQLLSAQVVARSGTKAFRKALKIAGLVGGTRTLGGAPTLPTLPAPGGGGDLAENVQISELFYVRERLPTPRQLVRIAPKRIGAVDRPLRRHDAVGRRRTGSDRAMPAARATPLYHAGDRCVREDGCSLPSTLGWPAEAMVPPSVTSLPEAIVYQRATCPGGPAALRRLLRRTAEGLAGSSRRAGPLGLARLAAAQLRADEVAGRRPAAAVFTLVAALTSVGDGDGDASREWALAGTLHHYSPAVQRAAAVLDAALEARRIDDGAALAAVVEAIPSCILRRIEVAAPPFARAAALTATPALWKAAACLVPAGLGMLFLQASYFDGAMVAAIDRHAHPSVHEHLAVGDIITHIDRTCIQHMAVEQLLSLLTLGPTSVTVLREVELDSPEEDGPAESAANAAIVQAAVPVDVTLTSLPTVRMPSRVRATDASWLAYEVARGIAREICEAKYVHPKGARCALQCFDVCWRLCSPGAWQTLNKTALRTGRTVAAHVKVKPLGDGSAVHVQATALPALPGLFEALIALGVPLEGLAASTQRPPAYRSTPATCRCASTPPSSPRTTPAMRPTRPTPTPTHSLLTARLRLRLPRPTPPCTTRSHVQVRDHGQSHTRMCGAADVLGARL